MSLEPVVTNNSLKDIVDWLALGDIVCLHTQHKKLYYVTFDFEKNDFIGKRLIHVDLSTYPDLLEDDEWPYYIYEGDTFPDKIFRFKV